MSTKHGSYDDLIRHFMHSICTVSYAQEIGRYSVADHISMGFHIRELSLTHRYDCPRRSRHHAKRLSCSCFNSVHPEL